MILLKKLFKGLQIKRFNAKYTVHKRTEILRKNKYSALNEGQLVFYLSCSGGASNRFMTEDSNVVQKFILGFTAMFDKGFIVQDIFLPRHVTVTIPSFVRSKRQFTPSEIHVCK